MKNLILLFVIIPLFVFGQKKEKNFEHYIGFYGGYSTFYVGNDFSVPENMNFGHHYFFGCDYKFYPIKFLFFGFGLQYDKNGFKADHSPFYAQPYYSKGNYAYPDSVYNLNFQYHQIGLPLKVGLNPGNKVFGIIAFGLMPGITLFSNSKMDLIQKSTGETLYSDQLKNDYQGMFTFSIMAQLGIGFRIKEGIKFSLSATFNRDLVKGRYEYIYGADGVINTSHRVISGRSIKVEIGFSFKLSKLKPEITNEPTVLTLYNQF